jgi:hypothetical protein
MKITSFVTAEYSSSRSDVKHTSAMLVMTLMLLWMLMKKDQMPTESAMCGIGRRMEWHSLYPSTWISSTLFASASSGTSGKADTKSVTKPYCTTISE